MLTPGQPVPDLDLHLTIDARFQLSKQSPDAFTMLVFYRGKHCPICKKYLEELGSKLDKFTALGVTPFAISMDSRERAMVSHEEWATHDLPLAYDLPKDQAREWGLFLSSKREGSDEPELFSEPGLFLIKPDGTLYFEEVQSGPFARPPLDEMLSAIEFVLELSLIHI